MADKLAIGTTEAARLLGISRPTLYQLLNRADFPSFRVGGRVLISVAGLQASLLLEGAGCIMPLTPSGVIAGLLSML